METTEDPISEILHQAGFGVGKAILGLNPAIQDVLYKPIRDAIKAAYNLGYDHGCREANEGRE